jgi:hypothetical protein
MNGNRVDQYALLDVYINNILFIRRRTGFSSSLNQYLVRGSRFPGRRCSGLRSYGILC